MAAFGGSVAANTTGVAHVATLVDRLVARPARRPVAPAVVLSGGGNLGAFQVGVIDVLERRGMRPSMLVGTSVGALNAAFWAFDPGPGTADRLLELWCRCGRATLFPEGPVHILRRLALGRDHVQRQHRLARVLGATLGGETRIEEARVPLGIVVVDATTGERHVLRSGRLLPALLASCAIPGLFEPVEIDGRLYMDGGVVANCDVEAAADAGAREAVAIDIGGEMSGPRRNVLDAMRRAVAFNLRRQTDVVQRLVAGRMRLALLRASLLDPPAFGDFRWTRELCALGRRAGEHLVSAGLDPVGRVRPGLVEFKQGEHRRAPSPLDHARW
jgi:NTE family protein